MKQELLYEMIFKRKSFHLFRDPLTICDSELQEINHAYEACVPLDHTIKTRMKIVPAEDTTCKRGQEYCILLYSEKKENYRQNIGYIGEQLDLYLVSMNIGVLWFGIGKVKETVCEGLDFVIMLAIAKMPADKFRKDMFKSKRKPLDEIWQGGFYEEIGNIVRFAPSACNTQPWKVYADAQRLEIRRYKKPGKRGIMPADKVAYYNRIDMGIFLLILEICMRHHGIVFDRVLYEDECDDGSEEVLAAEYIFW